ncbi:hypothetical protein LZ31DRAFT_196462 [Colletotrichum somersetense]|nr:hypothetical protein LZ31DRAFT_196462 [Colletotrichum somersetense]
MGGREGVLITASSYRPSLTISNPGRLTSSQTSNHDEMWTRVRRGPALLVLISEATGMLSAIGIGCSRGRGFGTGIAARQSSSPYWNYPSPLGRQADGTRCRNWCSEKKRATFAQEGNAARGRRGGDQCQVRMLRSPMEPDSGARHAFRGDWRCFLLLFLHCLS